MKINKLIIKIYLSTALLLFSSLNYAGLYGLTHHSRANCLNNETISWDLTQSHMLETISYHAYNLGIDIPKEPRHSTIDSFKETHRSAAVCWGEGKSGIGWIVTGRHWMKDGNGKNYIAASESVDDCSIYDGWWDH